MIVILSLTLAVIGLLLPQDYQVQKSIKINTTLPVFKSLVGDFSQWYKWSPWQQIDPEIEFNIGEPSSGTGAHQSWHGKWGHGEMTITSQQPNEVVFNVLFNQEHIITSRLQYNLQNNMVTWSIQGHTTFPLVSGYMAIFAENILDNTMTLGLNNLKTVAQLTDTEELIGTHDSQNDTSKN